MVVCRLGEGLTARLCWNAGCESQLVAEEVDLPDNDVDWMILEMSEWLI